ncbi:MAG TPA: DUF177 domain-containing protein [Bacteroidales bacterium]|nr:DUF177 domain-containing protein [Bacteroidales bacterium]
MNYLAPFNIAFAGLLFGKHKFLLEVKEDFFSCFEHSEIKKGNLSLELMLDKQNSMMSLYFSIKGNVELVCDLCLETYQQPIDVNKRLFVKFGETFEEQTDEIVIIPSGESHFNIAQYVYEYIHLGLPMRHVHAQYSDGTDGCNPAHLEKLRQYMTRKDSQALNPDSSPWNALKGLKFDN